MKKGRVEIEIVEIHHSAKDRIGLYVRVPSTKRVFELNWGLELVELPQDAVMVGKFGHRGEKKDLPFGRLNESRSFRRALRQKEEPNADALFKTILQQERKGLMAYAQTYAKAGIGMHGEALRVQIYYVLCNLGGWRGEEARKMKAELKKVSDSIKV